MTARNVVAIIAGLVMFALAISQGRRATKAEAALKVCQNGSAKVDALKAKLAWQDYKWCDDLWDAYMDSKWVFYRDGGSASDTNSRDVIGPSDPALIASSWWMPPDWLTCKQDRKLHVACEGTPPDNRIYPEMLPTSSVVWQHTGRITWTDSRSTPTPTTKEQP